MDRTSTPAQNETAPPDPQEDVLGWENGVWYNESVAADPSDGFNRTETRQLLNRTMARVERIREVEFKMSIDVHYVSRSEFADYVSGSAREVPKDRRTYANLRYEALMLLGEETSAVDVLRSKQASFAVAFVSRRGIPRWDVDGGDVVVVTDGQAVIRESVLGHELVHSLQTQELGYPARRGVETYDGIHALQGVTEGDAEYVQYLYTTRCGERWECYQPETPSPNRTENERALTLLDYVQYADGPALVAHQHERGGWDAVERLYDDPPASTEQLIHPGDYGSDRPVEVTVTDRSSDGWSRLRVRGTNVSDRFGEAGLFAMLYWPAMESGVDPVLPRDTLFEESQPSTFGASFQHPATAGWDGDRFVPYVHEDGETGYVWRIEWESPDDAAEFVAAYEDLLAVRGGSAVDGEPNTYRIPDDRPYGDAFRVVRNGSTVTIVNAPSVDALDSVHRIPSDRETTATNRSTPTSDAEPATATGSTEAAETTTAPAGTATTTDDTVDARSPGFTVGSFVVALVALAVLAMARRRR